MEEPKVINLSTDIGDLAETLSNISKNIDVRNEQIGQLLEILNNALSSESSYYAIWDNHDARKGMKEMVHILSNNWDNNNKKLHQAFDSIIASCQVSQHLIKQAKEEGYEII
jgi:hypothetical protein